MNDPEHLPPNANAAEIAEWMGKDLKQAVVDGIENASGEDEHGVVEVEIINHERDKVVGTVDTDESPNTENEALRNVSQEHIKEGVPVTS